MDDSTVICDEIINVKEKNFNEKKKKITSKTQIFYILLAFLSITIVLLIAVSINCYMIKYRRKHLFHFTTQIINQTSFILIA